jgi:hypothetical protein
VQRGIGLNLKKSFKKNLQHKFLYSTFVETNQQNVEDEAFEIRGTDNGTYMEKRKNFPERPC